MKRAAAAVTWHLPKGDGTFYKRAFASTPQATSDLISLAAEDGATWSELVKAFPYDPEATAIAVKFVEADFGDFPALTHLSPPSFPSSEVSHG